MKPRRYRLRRAASSQWHVSHHDIRAISDVLVSPLLVVLPVCNEEANIRDEIERWMSCLRHLTIPFQILALDDGSRDGTSRILLEMETEQAASLCVVSKPNTGHGTTCRIGYDIAVNSAAEWVLQIDSDGQCDPQHFFEFWNRRESFDCVFGVRTTRDDGLARAVTSAICRLAASALCAHDLRDANVPYRLMRRETLEVALRCIPPTFQIHNVALTYVLKKLRGVRWSYVPIHFPARRAGPNRLNMLKIVAWGVDMLLELIRIRVPPAERAW